MATLPLINTSALKVTFPANLPRNEKDLICMLLAGRLKDLWTGRLICAQLAIDDLIKDVTGVSGLGALRDGLIKVKSSLNDMRRASGYDKILGKVNSALGQVNQVFSLGGLCPSPVQAPKIPDILSTLNQNLFGQANGILNALAQASNPKVCLGGGPKGFSLDWSKVTGDLKLLKGAINQFKSNPAGFKAVMDGFEQNLKNQAKRLNSEITRLEKNLTDPLGINDSKNTVGAIRRVKSVSDDYAVKDRNGIEYKNPSRMMIPAEVDYVIDREDPIYVTPIKYVTTPILDYCGNIVGYEKKVITGDPTYTGWDPNNDSVNTNTPTENPVATTSQYDFTFVEENNTINVYNNENKIVPTIEIKRGIHYRIGLKLTTKKIKIYKEDKSVWFNGLTLTKEPDYGKGFEIVEVNSDTNLFGVELDWAVSIENPTTPNKLYWGESVDLFGTINISGVTEIPETDKTYDMSMAAKKAWMHLYKKTVSIPTGGSISHEETFLKRRYNMSANIVSSNGSWSTSAPLIYGTGYKVLNDDETIDDNGNIVEGNKISRWVLQLSTSPLRYLIIKKYYNETSGIKINQVSCYIADSLLPEPDYFESLASLKYDEPIELLNDITLPYTDFNGYKLALLSDGKLTNNDEFKIELLTEGNNKFFIINLTTNRENDINSLPVNEFVYTSKIKFDPTDYSRNFINSDPREERTYMHFKGNNGLKFECIIEYLDDNGTPPTYSVAPTSLNITEGDDLKFNVSGTDIINGTYYWTITNSKDFENSSGSFTITDNAGSFTVIPTIDSLPEGAESFTASIHSGGITGEVLATSSSVTIDDLAQGPALRKALAALSAKVDAASRTLATAASVASGGSVYVANSDADPFVTGPTMGLGKVLITDPDGTTREAVDGRDFYWNRDAQPVFFKDLEVVSVTKVGGNSEYYPDGGLPANRPGYVATNYNNGHSMLEEIPLSEWNPPLAAMNSLPKDEARALLNEYTNSRGITFMTNGGFNELGSFYSDDYRSFLESKGVTGESTPPPPPDPFDPGTNGGGA
jgi:hypothetical protein